ncbi:D-beta-hydroxybutyrate dehydrogenase, mitochondrial [Ostrinia nubilalis]|uniref:D-beta-hydroxybutyrate dehydrogenase, mitochondrial n=1 Tax=Ostrinia nubilalis TaxID=29057 RepID=UPI00308237CF
MSSTRVVAITGCDSGLGWAIAARAAREGLVTVAGMLKGADTPAGQALKKLSAHPCQLDVTDNKSVSDFKEYVDKLLKDNPNYKLHAIVNNAGVMTIGDYEWQRPSMIEATINVNLLGAMRVVSAFLPDLRRTALQFQGAQPRVINVASHCGLQPLAGFGAYSASKAGLLAWTQSLRLEHAPHDLTAVAFIPGGFVGASSLLSKQADYGSSMLEHLDEEQKAFYGKRITALNNYLAAVSCETSFDSLKDEIIIETFVKALTDEHPKELYKVESWRYMFYYNILKLPLPESVRRRIMNRFLSFPVE